MPGWDTNHTPKQALERHLLQWLDEAAHNTFRPRTFVRYQQLQELNGLPTFGRVSLAISGPQHLGLLHRRKFEERLSPRTVQLLHLDRHRVLRQAANRNLLGCNPSDTVDPPTPKRQEIMPLRLEQARKLLFTASGDHLEALYVLSLTTSSTWEKCSRFAGVT